MKRSQIRCWKSYCTEPLDKIEHYEEALSEGFEGWCIHHRREIQPDGTRVSAQELKDQGLYCGRPASELIFMRFGEHSALHNKDKVISEEHRKKLSEALSGENNPNFGKQFSNETRQKLSESLKGRTFSEETRQKMSVNNGRFWKGNQLSEEHCQKLSEAHKGKHHTEESRKKMSAANKGKHCWNNGVSCIRSKECPGEGWTRGRLRLK